MLHKIFCLLFFKSGFKPKSFHSSRKDRNREKDEHEVQNPEDFMDEEVNYQIVFFMFIEWL